MTLWSTAIQTLSQAGIESPELDARLLLAHALGMSREELILRGETPLASKQQQHFDALITRRAAREPMSHILGMREFYGRTFNVTSDVLDPRPDTETLIDTILDGRLTNPDSRMSILDIGTGSGCIIITLLQELPHATGVGVDISPEALTVAAHNAKQHHMGKRLTLKQASLFDLSLYNSVLGDSSFDIIVSNPPYIPTADIPSLMPEVYNYEPNLALNGGKDGLDCYRELAKSAGQLLGPNGLIFLEIGAGQHDDVADIFHAENWQLQSVHCDLAGHQRCVVFNLK